MNQIIQSWDTNVSVHQGGCSQQYLLKYFDAMILLVVQLIFNIGDK